MAPVGAGVPAPTLPAIGVGVGDALESFLVRLAHPLAGFPSLLDALLVHVQVRMLRLW